MKNQEAIKLMRLAKKAVSMKESSDEGFNEIIAGLAKEASLNAEEVNRVVEWTNTIKMLNLYKSGEDKTSEFEVADPRKINGIIHKKASAPMNEFDYLLTDQDMYKLAEYRSAKPRQAESGYKHERAPIIKKAYAKLASVKARAEESKMLAYREKDRFLDKMAQLAGNLNKHYSETFREFEENAMSSLGKPAMPYIDVLQKMAYNNPRSVVLKLKAVTHDTDNLELLKEAMAASKLHHFYRNTAYSFSKVHEDFTNQVEGTLI